jgi:hypothetical protein
MTTTETSLKAPAVPAEDEGNVSDEQIWNELESEDNSENIDTSRADLTRDGEWQDDAKASKADAEELSDAGTEPDPISESVDGEGDGSQPAEAMDDATDPLAENAELKKQLADIQRRSAGQARKITSLIRERETLTKVAQPQDDQSAADRRAKLEAAKEEYGDVIDPVIEQMSALETQVGAVTANAKDRVSDIDAELNDVVLAERQILEDAHPDFKDVISKNRKLFDQWIDDQPRAIRDLHQQNAAHFTNGAAAALVVDRFKQALAGGNPPDESDPEPKAKQGQAKRQRQLAGSASTTVRTPQARTTHLDPDSDDVDAHWADFERMDREKEKKQASQGW